MTKKGVGKESIMDHLEAMGNLAAARSAQQTQKQLADVQRNQQRQLALDAERKQIESDRLKIEQQRAAAEIREREMARKKEEDIKNLRLELSEAITYFNDIKRNRPV